MLSTSTYYRSFVGRNISDLPINETFYDDFVTFNAHLLIKKLLQFYLMKFSKFHIYLRNPQNILNKLKNKRNKNHTLCEQEGRRIFPMIKTILIKLLIRLTANFLLRCLVKKYISRIFWPHMNILLTYQNKHVHIIIYIFS